MEKSLEKNLDIPMKQEKRILKKIADEFLEEEFDHEP